MNEIDERLCKWPDGTEKVVVVVSENQGMANILWNEEHSPVGNHGCVVGLDDVVPLEWLSKLWDHSNQ